MRKRATVNKISILKVFGPILFGLLCVYLAFSPYIDLENGLVIKYDYILQHLPFYKEFFRNIDSGNLFWSWNSFLGTNFWASKAYYLIGDPYAWMTYQINQTSANLPYAMYIVLSVKFLFAYLSFYYLLSSLKVQFAFKVVYSLFYAFSGWNLVFIEHPMYTSFYSLLPLLFAGGERFIHKKGYFLLVLSAYVLTSINFYLFWIASIMFLVFWVWRTTVVWDEWKWKKFTFESSKVLFFYALGVLMAAVIWLPGIVHLLQSQRIGSQLRTYTDWEPMNIASFLMFSFVPMMKYLDGLFKTYWYYFNQVGLYYGVLPLMILPHSIYLFKTWKERIFSIILVIGLYALLINPRIGLFFHFTYSIRYTIIIVFFMLLVSSLVIRHIARINLIGVLVVQLIIFLIYQQLLNYQNELYEVLPKRMDEWELFEQVYRITYIYSLGLILLSVLGRFNSKHRLEMIGVIIVLLASIYELYIVVPPTLASQTYEETEIDAFEDEEFSKAIDYIKLNDAGFYRIYHNNPNVSNINLWYDFMSTSAYDTVYQYTLSDYLRWTRQYPATNWEFRFNEASFNRLMNVKYAIVKEDYGLDQVSDWYAFQIALDQDFGDYKIYQYRSETHLGLLYNQVDSTDVLNEYTRDDGDYMLYKVGDMLNSSMHFDTDNMSQFESYLNHPIDQIGFDPVNIESNCLVFDIDLDYPALLFLSIPYDEGWSIKDNGKSLEYYKVQGGFIGLTLNNGNHKLDLEFLPVGFEFGKILSIGSVSFLVLFYLFNCIRMINTKHKQSKKKTVD